MLRLFVGFFFSGLLFAILQSDTTVVAQEISAPLSSIGERLASPEDENPLGTNINQANIPEFHTLIPEELRPMIEAGELSLSAFRSWRISEPLLDESWQKESAKQALSQTSVEALGATGMPRAFPFGSFERISQQVELSPAQRVEQVLWNSQAVSASRASYRAEFSWKDDAQGEQLGFRGALERVVPRKIRPEDRTKQLFRERITLTAPKAIQSLSWLTFRFVDSSEDVVWSYSPAIKKVRQLVGTNRSDPFLGMTAALDDLLGFSAKIQLVEGATITKAQLLAPIYTLDSSPLKAEGAGCFSFAPDLKRHGSGNDDDSAAKGGSGPRLQLSSHLYVPRPLLRIELLQGDPYVLAGRQVLYVDSELFVPYYKIQFDRAGNPWKVTITEQAALDAPQGQLKIWLPTATSVYDMKAKSLTTVKYEKMRFCEEADPTLTLAMFDPKALMPVVSPPTKKEKVDAVATHIPLTPAVTVPTVDSSGE